MAVNIIMTNLHSTIIGITSKLVISVTLMEKLNSQFIKFLVPCFSEMPSINSSHGSSDEDVVESESRIRVDRNAKQKNVR